MTDRQTDRQTDRRGKKLWTLPTSLSQEKYIIQGGPGKKQLARSRYILWNFASATSKHNISSNKRYNMYIYPYYGCFTE